MWTPLQVVEHWEKISGETPEGSVVSETEVKKTIETLVMKIPAQGLVLWGVGGDNMSGYANYLGDVTSKELYPDLEPRKFEDYARGVLDGKAPQIYEELKAKFSEVMK
ncbi:hypothetical protein AC579_3083 [Pseudocercospora musae]|uniref:Uncharacterized protein n=1 Tax=Pseudocercospora musae TaxID=113226 RepID=A0A139IK60_9PEZI|nr:hypothetical protein AC579_3083 [Pseudocercospora musae]